MNSGTCAKAVPQFIHSGGEKMKKLLSVLLVACLLCTLSVPALGETAYTLIRMFISDTDGCNLGTPISVAGTWDEKIVMAIFDLDAGSISLGGTNYKGQKEVSMWIGLDTVDVLLTLAKLCGGWETLAGQLEYGYDMVFQMSSGEDEAYITSKRDADLFMEALTNLLK